MVSPGSQAGETVYVHRVQAQAAGDKMCQVVKKISEARTNVRNLIVAERMSHFDATE